MFTDNNTLKDVMEHPLLKDMAPYFVENLDLTKELPYSMSFKEAHKNGSWNVYSSINGFNRLLEAAESGDWCYPLYSAEEIAEEEKKKHAFFVWFPSLDPNANKRPFVMVVPGGGHVNVWNATEGYPIAAHFNRLGYHCFILTYRVIGPALYPKPLEDMARALTIIREKAEHFDIDPERYITVGFSAGAQLVGQWSTDNHGYSVYGLPRPVLNIPVYGGFSFKLYPADGSRDKGTMNLLGMTTKEAAASDWNACEHLKNYPPTYLAHAEGDKLVSIEQSYNMKRHLDAAGIPNVLDTCKGCGHGFAEGNDTPMKGWIERAVLFLENLEA